MSGAEFVRESIRDMSAYTLEKRSAEIKLDQNESPYDLPLELKQIVFDRLAKRDWNRYPDFELVRLRNAIAESHGLALENVLVGNGSNELILASLTTFVAPGQRVIFPVPTFALYEKIVTIMGGIPVPVRFDPATGCLPVTEMLAAAASTDEPCVLVVCSPNNPTGGSLREGELELLLASGHLVLFDRAYGDFTSEAFPALRENLITFSTFSKAWGLAGLRIGWLAATEANCREVRKVKLPYNLNSFSEEVAVVALEHIALKQQRVAEAVSERKRMLAAMRSIPGVKPYPSESNFISFETALTPKEVFSSLYARGLLIRDISSYVGMQSSLRVSVGKPEENDRFLIELQNVHAQSASEAQGVRTKITPGSQV